jgi:AraC family transcriptional regulator, arabinose operon regulatory protein
MDSSLNSLYYFTVLSFKQLFQGTPQQLLSINGIGLRERMLMTRMVNRPHGTGDFLFMYFYDPVPIELGGRVLPCQSRTLMIWRPGEAHHYGTTGTPWSHTWIHMDGPFLRGLIRDHDIPCSTPVSLEDPASMEKLVTEVHREMAHSAGPDNRILQNHVEICIRDLARTLRTRHSAATVPDRYHEIKQYIEEHFAEWIYLEDLARKFHLSPPHLSATYKKHFGISPMDHVIRLRMQHAVHLLSDCNLNISEVGAKVGYEDVYYFSKLFKKHHGMSPKMYRRKLMPSGQQSAR